jgi:hypothetical protein
MTEELKPEINRIANIKVNPPIYTELQDFAETLLFSKRNFAHYFGKYFSFAFGIPSKTFKIKDDTIIDIIDVQGIFYLPGDYRKFIALDDKGKAQFRDGFKPSETNHHTIKIIRQQDYELSDINKKVLEAIEEAEKIRNQSNKLDFL